MDILTDKYITGLYQSLEDEVIADIARRVKKTGRLTETAELMAKSMHELGYSPAKIQADVMKLIRADAQLQMEIAENTKAHKQEVQNIIDQAVKDAKKAGDALIAEAGNMAWNNDLSMWKEQGTDLQKPNSMNQMISAFRKQTNEELRNLTRSMGFKNTVLGTTGVMNAYQREMDLALLKVASGTFSFDQAVNDCVHRLAQSGLRSIDYANNRSYQLDTAARMTVRTSMSQLSGKIMEANLENSGHDLVITSQHMGSRPEHAPWQNKVFSFSGKSKKYPDFHKETEYGSVTGLKGANCAHDFYPFWEGASVIPDDIEEPAPMEFNGRTYDYYQATQKQRKMERDIRATKREIEAQEALGGNTSELQAKLRKQSNEYRGFSNAAGLKPRNNRLRVVGGSSNPKKEKMRKNIWKGAEGARSIGGRFVPYNENADFRISIPDYPDSINNSLSIAARKVVEAGSADKYEYSAIIDLESGAEVDFGTSKRYNSVDHYYKFLRANLSGKYVMIHSHNTHSSLSLPDLQELVMWENLEGVISVSNDGYINCVISNGKKTTEPLEWKYLDEINRSYDGKTSTERELLFVELAIRDYAKGGIITYGE